MSYKFKVLDWKIETAIYGGVTLKGGYLYGMTSDGHMCASSGLTRCDDTKEEVYSMKIYIRSNSAHICWTPIWVQVDPEIIHIEEFQKMYAGKEIFLFWVDAHEKDWGYLPNAFDLSANAEDQREWYYDAYIEYLSDDYCNWSCLDNDPSAIQLLSWESLRGSTQLQSVLDYNDYVHSLADIEY